ncbi:MAG TPA: tetratricopeptide repeat protein, partial [Isosphaeraceae bacterium]
MAGRSHLVPVALALALGSTLRTSRADDPKPDPAPKTAGYALPGEDPPAAFVPRTPRTVAEQKKLEATRLYVEARALEDQRQPTRAVIALEKALEEDPESVPILRRLSLLCGATGKTERSIEYGRRAVAADPGDAATIARIVEHYRRHEPAKAEPFLKEVLANPKLDKGSSEALVLEFELSQFYEKTGQFDKAADALAKVVEAMDTKAGNRLSPADQRRILDDQEAASYVKFGGLFLKANRRDLALRCFRRAEVYDDTSPQIPLMVAVVLLEGGKPAEALEQVERAIKRQHQGREAYDVLAQVLKKLGRQAEVLPRTEAAAKAEPKNIPLQYALADRYREAGQPDKADDLIKILIEVQPDLKGFGSLYASLLKDRKTEELLQLLTKVAERLRRDDAVDPQIAA